MDLYEVTVRPLSRHLILRDVISVTSNLSCKSLRRHRIFPLHYFASGGAPELDNSSDRSLRLARDAVGYGTLGALARFESSVGRKGDCFAGVTGCGALRKIRSFE